jgi:predicted permease
MLSFANQLRQVLRRLGRTPTFTAVTLITLALGAGANIAIFSVVEGVLLKPLPYPHPEQLVSVWQTTPGADTIGPVRVGPSNYFIFREQSRAFQDIGLWENDSVSVTGVGEPEQVPALDVTREILPILGQRPLLGREFTQQDDSPDSPATAILNYGYWQSKFSGDPGVIGRTIVLDGKPRQIIGVMPEGFHFLDERDPAVLLPEQLDRNHTILGQFHYNGIARLRPGVTIAEADADVARMIPIVLRSFPPPPGYSLDMFRILRLAPELHPLRQDVVGDVGKLLWVLMGGIGLVLLIACANVANLLLVRTEGRQQELAVRAALGATRRRIAAELLLESLVIGLLGSALGLGFAYAALRLLVTMAPSGLPRLAEIGIDGRVLLFTLGVAVLVSLLFGSVPVARYAGERIGTRLREGGRTPSQSRQQHRARNALVTVQVALAFVLLVCSGLMIRTFLALAHVDPGFIGPDRIQTFSVYISGTDQPDPAGVLRIERDVSLKIAALPGVSSVGFANSIPMAGGRYSDPIWTEDRAYAPGEAPPVRTFIFASPEFFHTMGIALVAGRELTWNDSHQKIPVALVSKSFAREYWRDPAAAIGHHIRASNADQWRQIVGVVGDVHYDGMNVPACSCVYWPLYNVNLDGNPILVPHGVAFVIRSPRAGSQALLREVRRAVWSMDANLPLTGVHTMSYYLDRSMARTSFTLVMLGIAGGMALLLAIVGLYGVVAYSVSQRRRDIGIRMALGAREQQLTRMFLRQGLALVGIGVACGLGAALAVIRLMSSLLFGVGLADPVTYLAAAVGLVAAAALANYLPSRRAARVDPVEALRAE